MNVAEIMNNMKSILEIKTGQKIDQTKSLEGSFRNYAVISSYHICSDALEMDSEW